MRFTMLVYTLRSSGLSLFWHFVTWLLCQMGGCAAFGYNQVSSYEKLYIFVFFSTSNNIVYASIRIFLSNFPWSAP